MNPNSTLDRFEEDLLVYLRGVVAERAASEPLAREAVTGAGMELAGMELAGAREGGLVSAGAPGAGVTGAGVELVGAPGARRRFRRSPWVRGGAVIATAAAAAGAFVLSPLGADPAFAVSTRADGVVSVTINRAEGAQALEQALAEVGIPADVTYLPADQECARGRFVEARGDGSVTSLAMGSDGATTLTVNPAALKPGQRFVLTSSMTDSQSLQVFAAVSQGPVGPCVPVPSTHPGAPTQGASAAPTQGTSASST